MPQAVMHVLLTIIVIDLYRDYIIKDKKKIPLHFIFIGGVAGLLPDIDIPFYWLFKNVLGLQVEWFHRTFTHSLFFPAIFLLIAILFYTAKKHKLAEVFAIISFGITFHILLDALLAGYVMPFFPFSIATIGLNIIPTDSIASIMPGLDAILLLAWLYHEEKKHKISDFI